MVIMGLQFSRQVLKEDFKTGLKDIDDAQQEGHGPNTFDPSVHIRDYDAVVLPVFTVTARDYVRITGQVKGDGSPACFSNVEETRIPDLKKWCHHLTEASRMRAARGFREHLTTFSRSIIAFLESVGEISSRFPVSPGSAVTAEHGSSPSCAKHVGPADDVQVPRLVKFEGVFRKLADDCVAGLQDQFRTVLQKKFAAGATHAAGGAVETADSFAASMRWNTYRATVSRYGSWHRDLNEELSSPLMRRIARPWAMLFSTDLFAPFEEAALNAARKVIEDAVKFAAPDLQERAQSQCHLSMEEVQLALKEMVEAAWEAMNDEQKEVTRRVTPYIKEKLAEGYDSAMAEQGKGSDARRKAIIRDRIADLVEDDLFIGATDVLMNGLIKALQAVGEELHKSLIELGNKIEVSLSILWELDIGGDPEQAKVREDVATTVHELLHQLSLREAAA
ncbi:hypothetical protein NUW54_g2186 [Trametes sanguinea]|uniref:Uncharacterized protein n=1 Tax=Trametes sanguinea TaxID=158606 RepID=A0ACC1Q484_9APHY|nr:hypothetical protein NUW54_g2186 [Trametes sanguinea]